ncbi:ABC transporter permease [Spongiivirga citrea]|uniref:FtsX-like permease family protein n=1 Tax=Spongiivirga citrea TaxID=1481457 RepID=A0A6M0CJL1_9FLAO|nr:FtsX-like permease family protein [Spongiivirga citrea]NER16119.1 FtsX-like permease family protein [Spongiivirga citrea]
MNLEYFIAKRIIGSKHYKSSISGPIIKIAISAIALGLIMMMVAIAVGVGLQQKIRDKVAAFNGHIQIVNFDNNNSQSSGKPISTNQEFYPEFKTVDGIKHIQAVATKAGVIRTENTFEGIVLKGVGADYQWQNFDEFIVEGRTPKVDEEKENKEVILSAYMANRLQLSVGDSFGSFFLRNNSDIPNKRNFTIVGLYDSGFKEFDEKYVFADIRHIQRMNRWKPDEVGSFEVFIDDFSELQEKGNEVYGSVLSTLNTTTIADQFFTIFEWLAIFDFNILIIMVIMIFVAGINMITALLVLILERTPMIGIFKAMGMQNRSIRQIFLYNAGYLIVLGLLWGNVIGVGLLYIQKKFGFIKLDPVNYYVTEAPVYIDVRYIIALNLGVLLLCVLMLLLPSQIITKISPVKAIRFD